MPRQSFTCFFFFFFFLSLHFDHKINIIIIYLHISRNHHLLKQIPVQAVTQGGIATINIVTRSRQQKPSSPETDASTASNPGSNTGGDQPDVSTEKKDLFDDGNLFLFYELPQCLLTMHVLELWLLTSLLQQLWFDFWTCMGKNPTEHPSH